MGSCGTGGGQHFYVLCGCCLLPCHRFPLLDPSCSPPGRCVLNGEGWGRIRTIRKVFQTATLEIQELLWSAGLPIIRLLSGLPFIGLLTPLPARVSVRSVLGVLEARRGGRCSSPNAMAFFSKSSLYCVSFYPLHCEGFRFLWRWIYSSWEVCSSAGSPPLP